MARPRARRAALGAALALALAAASLAGCAGQRPPAAAPAAPAPAAATAPSAPAGRTLHRVPVEGHGALEVAAPSEWLPRLGAEPSGASTLELAPRDRPFVLLLTPFSYEGVEGDSPQARLDAARLLADLARRKMKGRATEEDLPLQEVSGPGVRGYWFEATDPELVGRAPEEGEYASMLQGAASVGPLLVAFTLLDHGDGPQRDEALRMVATLRALPRVASRAIGEGGAGPAPTAGVSKPR